MAGLGAIGLAVVEALANGIEGLSLACVASGSDARATKIAARFSPSPAVVRATGLAEADIVVEAAPASAFAGIAEPAIAAGRILVPCSVGALLQRPDLIDKARQSGARIVVPTGALLGLDAVRAVAEGNRDTVSVVLETRKPPAGLRGAPHIDRHGIALDGLTEPVCVSTEPPSKRRWAFRPT